LGQKFAEQGEVLAQPARVCVIWEQAHELVAEDRDELGSSPTTGTPARM
jgi:hypothetical protein